MVRQRTASACSISSVNEHLSSPRDSGESDRIKGHRAWISNPLPLSYKEPSKNEVQSVCNALRAFSHSLYVLHSQSIRGGEVGFVGVGLLGRQHSHEGLSLSPHVKPT